MMYLLNLIWISVQGVIGFQLIFPLLLIVIRSLRSTSLRGQRQLTSPDYAVIVTAYEQTDQLNEVVQSILTSDYHQYTIYIVADKCDVTQLHFSSDRVVLLRPEQVLAGNVRSHFYAIDRFVKPHTHLVIIDSDNLVTSNFLTNLNVLFDQGYLGVQGVRRAKNTNTTLAKLDAARDIYYHYYDGKMLFEAGSSATLAGSGMAFTTALYRQCLEHKNVSGAGFDKVLQNEIVKRGHRIAFAENAVVYDEKTTGSEQLVNQRARWINTWFKYFSLGFGLVGLGILKWNWNRFLFGIVLLRPPLFIFLGLSLFFMIINVWFAPWIAVCWLVGMLTFVTGFFVGLVSSETDPAIYQSLWNIPHFVALQIRSLFKAKRANEISVATRHIVKKD